MKTLEKIIVGCSIIMICSACSNQPAVEDLMDEEVAKRIEKFKIQKRQNCQDFILDEAEKEVDSTMYLKIGSTLDGSITIPQKPMRPLESLEYKFILDTGSIMQLLPDSIKFDSLK
jgi:uncharacterized lipoprotein